MIPVLLETAGRSRNLSRDEDEGEGGRGGGEGRLRMVHSACATSFRDVEGGIGWALGRDTDGGEGSCDGMRTWLVGETTGTREFCSDLGPVDGSGGRTRLCPSEMLRWRNLTFAKVVLSSECDYCFRLRPPFSGGTLAFFILSGTGT